MCHCIEIWLCVCPSIVLAAKGEAVFENFRPCIPVGPFRGFATSTSLSARALAQAGLPLLPPSLRCFPDGNATTIVPTSNQHGRSPRRRIELGEGEREGERAISALRKMMDEKLRNTEGGKEREGEREDDRMRKPLGRLASSPPSQNPELKCGAKPPFEILCRQLYPRRRLITQDFRVRNRYNFVAA